MARRAARVAPADERPLVSTLARPLDLGPDDPRSPWCIDEQRFEPFWNITPEDYDRTLVSISPTACDGTLTSARLWVYLDYDELSWTELAHYIGRFNASYTPTLQPQNMVVQIQGVRGYELHPWLCAALLSKVQELEGEGTRSPSCASSASW